MIRPRTALALVLAAVALYASLGAQSHDQAAQLSETRNAAYAAAMEE